MLQFSADSKTRAPKNTFAFLAAGVALAACAGSSDMGTAPPVALSSAALSVPALTDFGEQCKLINNLHLDDPTLNNTHLHYNLRATDLGIPVAHGNDLFVFFGDSAGYRVIWPLGPESLPDAVGYAGVPASEVAANPAMLCDNLKFLHLAPENSIGPQYGLESDFAAQWMNPPAGQPISNFVKNPAGPRGANAFPNLPGDFEVPSGAFSHNGNIYVFYTTVQTNPLEMKGSYLAKWTAPTTSSMPAYQVLYQVDQRFNSNGQMKGRFINIAPVVSGAYVYLFGTGQYRQSNVYLGRKALATLETAGGYETYDPSKNRWVSSSTTVAGIVTKVGLETAKIGELSVRFFPTLNRWVMMDEEITSLTGNRIVARFADAPTGPWSQPVKVARMEDTAFRTPYCCAGGDPNVCEGNEIIHCDRAGFYAPYMLPSPIINGDGSFTVSFTMSTWDPYNVALMYATFR